MPSPASPAGKIPGREGSRLIRSSYESSGGAGRVRNNRWDRHPLWHQRRSECNLVLAGFLRTGHLEFYRIDVLETVVLVLPELHSIEWIGRPRQTH
jgi:hypothetical protein